ncbi:MAG: hypothetical protein AB1646_14455 [Thermodesulfobacteriota bacterium]
MSDKESEERQLDSTVQYGTSQSGAFFSSSHAAASDAMRDGMDLLRIAAEQRSQVHIGIKQGNLFEYIEAAKFNADAASKGSSFRAHVTEARGFPHAAADIEIRDGDRLVSEVQAKSFSRPDLSTKQLSKPKYDDMVKLVPKGQEQEVRKLAHEASEKGDICAEHYKDTRKNVTEELRAGEVRSGGTTYGENIEAARNPQWYVFKQEFSYVAKEAGAAGLHAAAAGGIVTAGISGVKNAIAAARGEKSIEDALIDTGKDAAVSAARSGGTGVTGTLIRYGAAKAGIESLAKANVATAVAAGAIDVGITVYSFAKGDISAEEAFERMGQTGTSTVSSIYAGAVAGLAFGPVGALVGSVAGYLVASNVYNSCVSVLRHARLAEKESARIVAICEEACREMEAQRIEFESFIQRNLRVREQEFTLCLSNIDCGLMSGQPEHTTAALADFAALLSRELQFGTFAEFDEFMMTSDETLVI